MKKITFTSATISLAATVLALPAVSLAAELTGANPINATGGQAVTELQGIINKIGNWALLLLGTLAAFYIILAAFTYVTARGDSKKVESARSEITYALVALVIGAVAKLITSIVGGIASGIQ
jgi:ribulose 1,5-bisphosphate carboxylase large subunit-like protein